MFVTLNGFPFFVTETGKTTAPPVVFLHGFPFSHAMWKGQVEALEPSHRAIAYDLRGHGLSYVGDGQYTIEGHVDDLLALLDHFELKRVVVVGMSMGGYIALRALQRSPERFQAAVLCDTRSEADTDEGKLKRFASIALVKRDGSAGFLEGFLKAVFTPESFTQRPQTVGMILDVMKRTPPLSITGTLLALAARTDTTPSLSSIRIPTLILVGEHDIPTPPAASKAMHAQIAGSEMYLVPHAGHMSNLENPGFFNERLLAFLHRVSSHNA